LRRACQLKALRPDVEIVSIRGNVQTRIRKILDGLSGGVLAFAGLIRLGLDSNVSEVLDPKVMLPAVGQGILGLEIRRGDELTRRRVEALVHPETQDAAVAERAFLARLGGGCQVPIAAYATLTGDELMLRGLVGWPDGHGILQGERRAPRSRGVEAGTALAEELLGRGAAEILSSLSAGAPAGR
jgi:hydroxymethylbilane synthase